MWTRDLRSRRVARAGGYPRGGRLAAINKLEACLNYVNALLNSRRISVADAAALTAFVTRIIASLRLP